MPNALTVLALLLGGLGLFFLLAAISALRRGRLLRLTARLTFGLLCFAVAALLAAVAVGTQGYRALTREHVAAVVDTEPLGPQKFQARFTFPDGRVAVYTIAGDELYVDAHILKWKPLANFFGLHTVYELDRVAGRYRHLDREQQAPRTVYGIGENRPIDLFDLRRRYAALAPLLDAEYGSATFVAVEGPEKLEVRVSTDGLLIRRVNLSPAS